MNKLESLLGVLKYQVEKGIDITLMYKKTDLNGSEILSLESAVCRNKHYYYPQTKHIEEFGYNCILSQRQEEDEILLRRKRDEEVATHEKKVEQEEDARDEREKKRKEKESERKKKNSQKKKESDESFYEEWADKFKALKNLIPDIQNNFEGKGKEKKFKAEFRRRGNLLLEILKTLN